MVPEISKDGDITYKVGNGVSYDCFIKSLYFVNVFAKFDLGSLEFPA